MNLAWALPLAIVLQARSASVSPRPVAWAAQSPRPAACLGTPGLWELSRQAVVEQRCRALSRGQALLLRAPNHALQIATVLLEQDSELLAARVLRGRAALRVGQMREALRDLTPLVAAGASPIADPSALLDGGRAALAASELGVAADFYRALGSRAALLPDKSQQVIAYLEVAAVLLVTEQRPGDEVLGYLREAKRRAPGSGFAGLTAALTALAWSAKARDAEALAALSELPDPWALQRFDTSAEASRLSAQLLAATGVEATAAVKQTLEAPEARSVWLPDGLMHAALGLALERRDAALSRAHYRAFADSPLAAQPIAAAVARRAPREGGKPSR